MGMGMGMAVAGTIRAASRLHLPYWNFAFFSSLLSRVSSSPHRDTINNELYQGLAIG